MPDKNENPEARKLEEAAVSYPSPQKRIEAIAETAARKAARTEQRYDQSHGLFTH